MNPLTHKLFPGLLLMAVLSSAKAVDLSTRLDTVEYRSTKNENRIIALESNLDLLRNASASKAANLESSLTTLKAQVAQIPPPVKIPRHDIGELYQGGLVFQVDEGGQHGLVVALKDASEDGLAWRNGASGNKTTNARADGIYAGEANTRLIVAAQTMDNQKGSFAALAAMQFRVAGDGLSPCEGEAADCYGNWYLPSGFELKRMHRALIETGILSVKGAHYWSSTESSVTGAYSLDVATGQLMAIPKSNTDGLVRPISRF